MGRAMILKDGTVKSLLFVLHGYYILFCLRQILPPDQPHDVCCNGFIICGLVLFIGKTEDGFESHFQVSICWSCKLSMIPVM